MSDTIDAVMQAAERLRHALDATCVDLENMPVEAEVDLLRLARFALSILPKGKRPVAIEWDGDEDLVRWTVIDGEVCDCRATTGIDGGPATYANRNGKLPRGAARFGQWPLYPTEADAKLALHWQRLDELRAFAS